ncbi:protein YciZ, partial [Escherichia coli]
MSEFDAQRVAERIDIV